METFEKYILSIFIILIVSITAVTIFMKYSPAGIVSYNLSKEADYFNVERRVVFYNGITGEYMLVIEGKCSLGNQDKNGELSVTCKTGEDTYKKHFLGLSDNVTYFVEQVQEKKGDENHYKVVFKPSAILPDIDIR